MEYQHQKRTDEKQKATIQILNINEHEAEVPNKRSNEAEHCAEATVQHNTRSCNRSSCPFPPPPPPSPGQKKGQRDSPPDPCRCFRLLFLSDLNLVSLLICFFLSSPVSLPPLRITPLAIPRYRAESIFDHYPAEACI